uniref:GLSH6409 n=1 Tax=Homo sapiens TaxID=9606 RepID=Q6UXV5_HUMAN|nr:GLSH6409 [Homo sapiens]
MGLSHFLLLPLLYGDKTLGTQLWTERSSNRLRGTRHQGSRSQASPLSAHLTFPIFPISCDLFLLSLPPHHPFLVSLLLSLSLRLWCHPDALGKPARLVGSEGGCHFLPTHSPSAKLGG